MKQESLSVLRKHFTKNKEKSDENQDNLQSL